MVGNSPCASCKLLRRRCAKDCIFAPYFPSDDPQKFAIVHKVFGASNVSKMLQELPVDQRSDAVSSLVYEANARVRDPVYGCVGAISYLQNQVSELQMQLAVAQAEILCIQMQHHPEPLLATTTSPPTTTIMPNPSSHNNIIIDHTTTDDQKPYIFHHQNDHVLLPSHHHHHQYLNFASNNSNNVIHDSLSRESIFGHDMVS